MAKAKAEKNTFGLPRGDQIRRGLRADFRAQRAQVLAFLGGTGAGKKDNDPAGVLPDVFPDFVLGALRMSERMTPLLSALWDRAGQAFFVRLGIDPDRWRVTNPHTADKVRTAALAFCAATNATTSKDLARALDLTRDELAAGVVTRGDSVARLTARVNGVFESAEKWRARAIAQTEASRAVHGAQEAAAVQSGMVAGWEWLLSADACPLCQTVARRAKFVKLGDAFAITGDNPDYGEARFPPLHPHCNCTVVEVLKPEYGGPEDVEWSPTLVRPVPEDEDKPDPVRKTSPKRPGNSSPPAAAGGGPPLWAMRPEARAVSSPSASSSHPTVS